MPAYVSAMIMFFPWAFTFLLVTLHDILYLKFCHFTVCTQNSGTKKLTVHCLLILNRGFKIKKFMELIQTLVCTVCVITRHTTEEWKDKVAKSPG